MCFLAFSAVGFTNGSVRILDGLMLKEEGRGDGLAVFSHCHDCVTNIKFSHDSHYLATSVSRLLANRTVSESVGQIDSQTDVCKADVLSQGSGVTFGTSYSLRPENMTFCSKINATALLFPLKIDLIH